MKRRSCSNHTASLHTNKEESKLRSLLFVVLPVLLTVVIQIISYFAAFFLTFLFYGNSDLEAIVDNGIFLFLRSTMYLIAFGYWYYRIISDSSSSVKSNDSNASSESTAATITPPANKWQKRLLSGCIAFLCGAALQVIFFFILGGFSKAFPQLFTKYKANISTLIPSGTSAVSTVLILLSVILLSPIAEELLFRGVSFSYARRISGPVSTIMITAILFGIYHFDPVQSIYACIAGIILGILKERTGKLYSPILFHIAFNLTSYLLLLGGF